jgi:DNA-nicking Smr family endonuclease
LPVLPVIKKLVLITGRGNHSDGGKCVLKETLKDYLCELDVQIYKIKGNDGAIRVFEE